MVHNLRLLYQYLFATAMVVGLFVLINPIASLDVALIALFMLIVGHLLLREKLILVFLALRPTLDYWRDIVVFQYEGTTVNITATLALLFLAWSLMMLYTYRHELPSLPLKWILPIAVILMFASVGWSVAKGTTVIESIKFLNLVNFFSLGYIFVRKRKLALSELLLTVVYASIVPILFAIWQLVAGAGITTFEIRGRIYGTLGHPNVFAFLMLSLIILHTQWSVMEPTKFWRNNRLLQITVYALLSTLLVFTYTRAALIGLVFFLIIIGVWRYRGLLIGLIITLSSFYLIFFPLNDFLTSTTGVNLSNTPIISRITTRNEDADSIAWRQTLLRETLPIIASRPIAGYGYGTFTEVWTDNRSLLHQFDDSAEAHNDYLRLALELGLVGLTVYCITIASLLWHAGQKVIVSKKKKVVWQHVERKRQRRHVHIFVWMLVFALLSLSDNMLHHTPVMWLTWAYWGAALAKPERKIAPNLLGTS